MDTSHTEPRPDSRWWYGVAAAIVSLGFTWVSWGVLRIVSETGAGSPPALVAQSPETSGLFVLSVFSTVLFVFSTAVATPRYTLSLAVDVSKLRKTDYGWRPSRVGWGAVSLLHLASVLFSPVQLLTVPAGV